MDLVRKKCVSCGFEFFTFYDNDKCGSCQAKNDNAKTVNSWNG